MQRLINYTSSRRSEVELQLLHLKVPPPPPPLRPSNHCVCSLPVAIKSPVSPSRRQRREGPSAHHVEDLHPKEGKDGSFSFAFDVPLHLFCTSNRMQRGWSGWRCRGGGGFGARTAATFLDFFFTQKKEEGCWEFLMPQRLECREEPRLSTSVCFLPPTNLFPA